MSKRSPCRTIALLALFALPLALLAAPIKPNREWKGSVADESLQKEAPKSGVITNAKDFEKLWKAWKIEGKVPEVNFAKEVVGVTTSRGSVLNLNANLDDKSGDLRLAGLGTRDLRPGFR